MNNLILKNRQLKQKITKNQNIIQAKHKNTKFERPTGTERSKECHKSVKYKQPVPPQQQDQYSRSLGRSAGKKYLSPPSQSRRSFARQQIKIGQYQVVSEFVEQKNNSFQQAYDLFSQNFQAQLLDHQQLLLSNNLRIQGFQLQIQQLKHQKKINSSKNTKQMDKIIPRRQNRYICIKEHIRQNDIQRHTLNIAPPPSTANQINVQGKKPIYIPPFNKDIETKSYKGHNFLSLIYLDRHQTNFNNLWIPEFNNKIETKPYNKGIYMLPAIKDRLLSIIPTSQI